MRVSCIVLRLCTLAAALALAGCGGSRGGCAAHVPVGPIPAGTPIPVQPLPANSGISSNVSVSVAFSIDANGTVTGTRIVVSSGSSAVDADAIAIVDATPFKSVDTNCLGVPARSGLVVVTFSPNA